MCGIVGYVGPEAALSIIIGGLSRLEYRGYDSAGVAYVHGGRIDVRKKQGRLAILNEALATENLLKDASINIGIGHTRWATHGAPSDENSHPHLSMSGNIAVVHNGIIENYLELRRFLTERGYVFQSETDTEVVAHLVEHHLNQMPKHDLLAAVRETLEDLEGSYALAVLCAENPNQFVAARKDSPLIVGLGDGCNYVASDIPAILSRTRDILIIEDREVVLVTRDQCLALRRIRPSSRASADARHLGQRGG